MKKMHGYFVVLGVIGGVFMHQWSLAQDQQNVSNDIEIVIQGKKYKSMRAYKRQKIKDELQNTLSSGDLREFSEDELYGIISEVRDLKAEKKLFSEDQKLNDQLTMEEEAWDPGIPQMEGMLNGYLKDHKDAKPLVVDPAKVKSIIIKAEELPKDNTGS